MVLLKTLIYRLFAVAFAFGITLLVTKSLPTATLLGSILAVVATAWYFIFEKLWARYTG